LPNVQRLMFIPQPNQFVMLRTKTVKSAGILYYLHQLYSAALKYLYLWYQNITYTIIHIIWYL